LRWLVQIKRWVFVACVTMLLAAAGLDGAAKPVYGGVLRVELRAASITLNPSRWKAGSAEFAENERLAELVFDRLVTLDNYGRFQPALATEWSHDGNAKRWEFTLRAGVKFADGSALTSSDVVKALQPLLPRGLQILATANGVVFQSANAANDLLEMLASGPYFIYRDDGKGVLSGTGPFVLESSARATKAIEKVPADSDGGKAQQLRFRYNDGYWGGRPYLDAIDVTLGVPPLRALLDVQLGKADLAEISEDTARRAQQANLKLWISSPLTLFAVRFATRAKTPTEQAVREALSLSVDRNAMARVLLQKQAEPSSSLLPQWLSGYAFLFDAESNLERAKAIRGNLPANTVGAGQPLRLEIDGNNDLQRLIAERAVVNARAAGLTLQIVARSGARAGTDGVTGKTESEAQLVAWRYTSLSAREALQSAAAAWHWEVPEGGGLTDMDARYAWEKRMLEEKNLLPLVAVPDFAVSDARVRNWSASSWGEWRLADVWLDQKDAASAAGDASTKTEIGDRP
jgi:peptide/nickel transport system substrate-binding protein